MCEAPTTTTRTTLVTARWDHCLDDDGDDHDDGGDCRDDGGDHHDGGVDGCGEKEKDNEEDGWWKMYINLMPCDINVSSFQSHWIFFDSCALCHGWHSTDGGGGGGSTKVLISRGKLNSVSVRESDS